MKELKDRFEKLNATSVERKEVLDEILPIAKEFEQCKSNVCEWLESAQDKVDELDVISVDKDELQKQEEVLKVSTSL